MAETSLFWDTGSTGDGLNPYSEAKWFQFIARMFQTNAGVFVGGVIAGFEGELEPTVSGSNIIVDAGGAVVAGIPYQADSSVTLTPTVPSLGTTGGFVGLRADYTAQTVRAVLKQSADGVAGEPAVTQTLNTLWEVRLASYQITTGGVITITTDRREFLEYPTALLYRRSGGDADDWSVPGISVYKPGMSRMVCGSIEWTGAAAASGTMTIPVFGLAFTETPIPMISAADANIVCSVTALDYENLEMNWSSRDGATTHTSLQFFWTAYGKANV